MIQVIKEVKSRWLSDPAEELARLHNFGQKPLPILHALELENALAGSHYVYAHGQSFESALHTMLIKEIERIKNHKLNWPYRQPFRLSSTLDKLKRLNTLEKVNEDLYRWPGDFKSSRFDIYYSDELLSVSTIEASSPPNLMESALSAWSFNLNYRLPSLSYYGFNLNKEIQQKFDSLKSKGDKGGVFNVIFIPKNIPDKDAVFYPCLPFGIPTMPKNARDHQARIFTSRLVEDESILTVRLSNYDKESMRQIKQEIHCIALEILAL